MSTTCVHDHLGSAVTSVVDMGGTRVGPTIAHIDARILPPGYVRAENGLGGWHPDDGTVYQFDSRGVGVMAHDANACPNQACRGII